MTSDHASVRNVSRSLLWLILALAIVLRIAAAHEALQEAIGRLVADVGHRRLVLPAGGRAQRKHALAGDAGGLDGEGEVGALGGRDVGERHAPQV